MKHIIFALVLVAAISVMVAQAEGQKKGAYKVCDQLNGADNTERECRVCCRKAGYTMNGYFIGFTSKGKCACL